MFVMFGPFSSANMRAPRITTPLQLGATARLPRQARRAPPRCAPRPARSHSLTTQQDSKSFRQAGCSLEARTEPTRKALLPGLKGSLLQDVG